jgi:RNA polymerase sigma-70 factor, ECF subfamily
MDTSDESLIRSIERGDRVAMRRLYERHAGDLAAFVRSRLKDPVEAADVVQDTFLEVWTRAGRFQARSSVRAWIYSIARNKAVDRIRKLSRLVVSEPDDSVPDDAPDAVAVIENAQDARRVRKCLDDLSEAQRAAVTLAFYDDMTYREIAEVEGVSEGTVKTRVFHAKKLLMRCLSR